MAAVSNESDLNRPDDPPSPAGGVAALLPWFKLKQTPGVGPLLFKRLLDRYQTPANVFAASAADLTAVDGIYHRLAARILRNQNTTEAELEIRHTLDRGFKIITFNDDCYPILLRQIPDPPPLLYVHGTLRAQSHHIAVVGSRRATAYGLSATNRLCRDLTGYGLTIVSGMARGIDTAAHQSALNARGHTVAVLGSGLANIYPRENRPLFGRIANSGAVISEFPLQAGPEAHHFPIRNRIISGISAGTIVVEAAKKSGSLITARLAVEQNREVFAVPGSIRSYKSSGTHHLLKQGAKLVENARDVIEELQHLDPPLATGGSEAPPAASAPAAQLTPEEFQIISALGAYPIHIDELGRKTGLAPGKLVSILLSLELKGLVNQAPGNLFSIQEVKS